MKTRTKALSLLTCIGMLSISITGCQSSLYHPAGKINAQNLMEGVAACSVHSAKPEEAFLSHTAELSLSLLRQDRNDASGENQLLSPISLMMALSLTANGTENQTLSQMETVLGNDLETLNQVMSYCLQSIPSQAPKVQIANSLWIKEKGFSPNQDFLQTAANYYQPDIYTAPFDSTTLSDINQWVSEKTDGQISKMLEEIPESAVLYLINTLLFDGKWTTPYEAYQVSSGKFFTDDGETQTAQMMSSTENLYLENDLATGFLKNYEGGRYAFGALLPRIEGDFGKFLSQLDGETLQATIENPQQTQVHVTLPKFSFSDSLELQESLKALGMTDAFSMGTGDFSTLGTAVYPLYISRILQKTQISVTETGTQASAATAVEILAGSAMPPDKVVSLNRPFLFFILDQESGMLLFLGTVSHMENL